MRADRLLSILLQLQNRGKMTSRELAQTLEVSERTIFRDMEALSAAGIPVLAERGREGGWKLTEGYRTSLTGMKPREAASLLLASNSAVLSDLGIAEDYTSAIRKLEAAAPKQPDGQGSDMTQRIYIDTDGWHPSDEAYPYLSILQQALGENRTVQMDYTRSGETRERLVNPLGLVSKRGVWYVVAEYEGELRTFRVSRISHAELTGQPFIRPEDFDLMAYWAQSTLAFKQALPRYPASLLVKETVLKELQRERYVSVFASEPSSQPGWLKVETEFNTPESACRILLSFGANIRVCAPAELREQILVILQESICGYLDIQCSN
ncbi:helix-turn-helix transcriptional regulator [Paenibacillus donghaensis]|uniref:Transcriptional regulator n=1 Tax=Paenibacillus donghaensis TaxID=414771 RepID=A0A2Z2KRC1_9BACL|nr:YafY family protein [Paenibacillus donghaensis]ASA22951.1 transcriptional regulator [Paenibacillus donghaensis]